MEKEKGFYVTRKRYALRLFPPPSWLWPAALLLALVLTAGAARGWPQSSDSSSSSSSGDLKTWEELSQKFQRDLTEQSTVLQQALGEIQTSKAGGERLTLLLGQSLKANDSLRNYNAQIADRMQTRDEDLAAAYDEIDRLEKKYLRLFIAFIIAIAAAAAGWILFIVLLIRR